MVFKWGFGPFLPHASCCFQEKWKEVFTPQMDFFINIWWSGLDFYLPWFILKSPEMGQYCNSLRKMCIRITEKLIRTGLSWSLLQAPAWSRANLKVCGGCSGPCVSWVLKVSQGGNWTSFPGPSSNFMWCSGEDFLLHSTGISLLQPGGVVSHPVTVVSWEESGSVYTAYLFHRPNHRQYNKTNLLEVVCLFVFFS